jgi:DNA-binding transcriptional ArsR family regulator
MSASAASLARFAALLADRSRAAICLALLDDRAWTAGELARVAGISRSTASEHLTILVSAGVCLDEHQGRHRYVRLASSAVAQLIEDLAAAIGEPDRPRSLQSVRAGHHLAVARTCYDHLAGGLGVAFFDALVSSGLIAVDDGLSLTAAGRDWFGDLAGGDALEQHGSRPLLRTCLDFTERRPHLGGALGAVLCRQAFARRWVERGGQGRAVTVTAAGSRALAQLVGRDREPVEDDVRRELAEDHAR